ncbi:heterokaryon incompatibility protein-domain-containing protein [Hypoxylon sp. FL1857]|nr:heterokaryon incompatibility protein-domain-containing protein [Hypoxylon sp. FL1857]
MAPGLQKFLLLPHSSPDSSPDSPYEQFVGHVVVDNDSDNESEADSIQIERSSWNIDEFDVVAADATNGILCKSCLKDLIIKDGLARDASTVDDSVKETPTLDLSRLRPKEWHNALDIHGSYARGRGKGDASGWIHSGSQSHGNQIEGHYREFCIGGDNERIATPSKLSESLATKCQFCAKLKELFCKEYSECSWWERSDSELRFYVQYEWVQRRTTISERGEENEGSPQVRTRGKLNCLEVIVQHTGLDHDHANVYKFDVEAWPDWLMITRSPLDPSGPVSDMNIQFMKHCIDKCIKDHEGCREKLSNAQFIPTRLLDVKASNDMVRLVGRNGILLRGSQPKYATLSYCWGSALTQKTTKGNIEEYSKAGIAVHGMPQTFKDAIKIVRKLGIRYLWIDALCIIQDQAEDWEAESVKMCDIFAHAYVTISAAISSSCSESFLERSPRNLSSVRFHSSVKPKISSVYSIQLDGREGFPKSINLGDSRWCTRAWVWQEQIMSTRQLIFAEKGFQFRCNNGIRLGRGPTTNDPEMTLNNGTSNINYWEVFLKEFTKRSITFRADRLAAVPGVAKYIHSSLEEAGNPMKYLAGLWLDSKLEKFCSHLLWMCDKPASSYEKMSTALLDEDQYCAPSWSWASREKGVDFRWKSRAVFKVMGQPCDLQPYCSEAMVRAKYGSSIVLRSYMKQTPVKPTSGHFNQDAKRWANRWEVSIPNNTLYLWLDWLPAMEDPEEMDRQDNLELLLLDVAPTFDSDGKGSAYGLLLLKFGDLHYRRVGMFQLHGDLKWLEGAPCCDVKIM